MEVHDPPDHTRYCPSAAGRIEFLSFSPATGLQKLNFRVADSPGTGPTTSRKVFDLQDSVNAVILPRYQRKPEL
jgi:hypothetical protein